MRKITAQLADELDREPSDEEIGYAMDMPVNKVAHLKSVSIRPASLDAPVGEDGDTTFGELVGDENEASPLENLQEKSISSDIKSVIERLEDREAEIIQLRFGLDGNHPLLSKRSENGSTLHASEFVKYKISQSTKCVAS